MEQVITLPQIAAEALIEIINKLPLNQRVCVFYHFHDKLTTAEIAGKLAISETEVTANLEAAQAKIQEELEKRKDDENFKPLLGVPLALILVPALKYGADKGIITVSAAATTATTATVTTTAAASAISVKAIAGIVAAVVCVAGITTAVVLGDFGNGPAPALESRERRTQEEVSATANAGGGETDETEPAQSTASQSAQTGETIQFGEYSWIVLETQADRMFIISEDILSLNRYSILNLDIAFTESQIYYDLNGEFFNSFDEADRARIVSDIQILTPDQADMYFASNTERIANFEGQPQWWWLQSDDLQTVAFSFLEFYYAPCVLEDGTILEIGSSIADYDGGGVRPALWLSVNEVSAPAPEPPDIPEYITIRGVEYSTELTQLDLFDMRLTDEEIEPLRYMVNLTLLNLNDNQISDISPLAGLMNLESLYLSYNQINDISLLGGLTNLTLLFLFDNQISDITPLSRLTNLTYLGLSDNQITDWSPVAHVEEVFGRPAVVDAVVTTPATTTTPIATTVNPEITNVAGGTFWAEQLEFAFDNDGRYFSVFFDSDGGWTVQEGTYTQDGDILTITMGKTIIFVPFLEGFGVGEPPPRTESHPVSAFTAGEPSGTWWFGREVEASYGLGFEGVDY